MKKENNSKKLNSFLDHYEIKDYFSIVDLHFELYRFEKGEFINNLLDPMNHLSFVVSGTIRILNVRDDGSLHQISTGYGFTCLGDVEFGSGEMSPYLIEAMSTVYCVSLPLDKYRKELEDDPVFLRYLLQNVTRTLRMATSAISEPRNLEERVIYYMENECEDMILYGVERASHSLSCSKRQLLRILKSLCKENRVWKLGKGKYQLIF